jgi:thiol-disulfide isomerase/thioredoxin
VQNTPDVHPTGHPGTGTIQAIAADKSGEPGKPKRRRRSTMNRGSFIAIFLGFIAVGGLIFAATSDDSEGLAAPTDAATLAAAETPENGGSAPTTAVADQPSQLEEAPPVLGPAGTLDDIEGWLQTDATSFEEFDGQVRIVQFWTHSCRNCTATIPFLQEIYAAHQPNGLEIIGVHAPEFEFEKDIQGVQERAIELGVTWPIAIDNDKTNFRSWQTERRFWPRTFVLDQNGDIRFDRIGEGRYDELNDTVAWLIANRP